MMLKTIVPSYKFDTGWMNRVVNRYLFITTSKNQQFILKGLNENLKFAVPIHSEIT